MKLSINLLCAGCMLFSMASAAHARGGDARAADDVGRDSLNRILAVLRLQPSAAGRSCLDTLQELHNTEAQIKVLSARAKDPDKELAQDVLESDYENGEKTCGADARTLCSDQPSEALRTACTMLGGNRP